MRQCITHHYACDCREAEFAQIAKERDNAQRALQTERGKLERADAELDAVMRELAAYKQAVSERKYRDHTGVAAAIEYRAAELLAANA